MYSLRDKFLILLAFCASCKFFQKETLIINEKPIARVNDSYLYYSDLEPILKNAIGKQDSASIVRSYIDEWIKRKLMLEKANQYLPEERLTVDKQVEDYRESLILYYYERYLILEKLDTTVADSILLKYFEEYKTNFELKEDVVQMAYVKVTKDAPKIDSLAVWIASKRDADKLKLEDYCHQYSTDYSLGDSVWYAFPTIYSDIPITPSQLQSACLYKSTVTVQDSLFNYVVKVNDKKSKGEIAPFDFVKSDIARIILNKRKRELVRSTFENVYLEGKRSKKFEIYQ